MDCKPRANNSLFPGEKKFLGDGDDPGNISFNLLILSTWQEVVSLAD